MPPRVQKLADGIFSFRYVARSSPTYQAAYRLGDGADSFNKWRSKKRKLFLDLSSLDIEGVDLSGVDLQAVKLRRSCFRNVRLVNAKLDGSNLNFVTFRNCTLTNASLKQARLAGADFTNQCLDGIDFFQTIRDGWIVKNVTCSFCWITRDRAGNEEQPDKFGPGEFEIAYGGIRFKIRFPGGIEPIDLLAFPYYVGEIVRRFHRSRIVLTGLSTIGDPGIEFRIDDARVDEPHPHEGDDEKAETDRASSSAAVEELRATIQGFFDREGKRFRAVVSRELSAIVAKMSDQHRMVSVMTNPREREDLLSVVYNIALGPQTVERIAMTRDRYENKGTAGIVGRIEHVDHIEQNLISLPPAKRSEIDDVLSALETVVMKADALPDEDRTRILASVATVRTAFAKEKVETSIVRSALSGAATAIQTAAAVPAAYTLLKQAAALAGLSLP